MWQLELLAEASGNLVREWRGTGLPLGAGMGCAVAFTCLCNRPKIHGDRTSVAYSTLFLPIQFMVEKPLKIVVVIAIWLNGVRRQGLSD